LPLSATLVYSLGLPVISIADDGHIAFTVPLLDILWQSRHQHILDTIGSPVNSNRMLPQRQPPEICGIEILL
jgi:hypothetical protein